MRCPPFIFFFILCVSCTKGPQKEVNIYENDFESGSVVGISDGKVSPFNHGTVLGRFNSESFTLFLDNLPDHDMIKVTFNLNIHDSWDGNQAEVGGPDIWEFLIDDETYLRTTFSNANCPAGTFCPPQSYPMNYPNSNNGPRTGAYMIDLPKACPFSNDYGTSTYRIEKTIRHSGKGLKIVCRDRLIQTNTDNRLCDESWSVDDIKIRAISLQ